VDQAITLRIRERAYDIWAEAGGDADRNWLQAELEILQTTNRRAGDAFAQKLNGGRRLESQPRRPRRLSGD
jgi:Protein of unknown function (DUF2934)